MKVLIEFEVDTDKTQEAVEIYYELLIEKTLAEKVVVKTYR